MADIRPTAKSISQIKSDLLNPATTSHFLVSVGLPSGKLGLVNKYQKELYRVLKDDGIVVLRCPDIQKVCEVISQDKLFEPLYESPIGPIYPIDILFGNRNQIAAGNEFMAKKVGFTYSVLDKTFSEAGFQARYGGRMPNNGGELAIVAFKQRKSEEEIKKVADPLLFT